MPIFPRSLNASAWFGFWQLQLKANLIFCLIGLFSGFRTPRPKKPCLRFVKFVCIKKLQRLFKTEQKLIEVIVQKWLSTKKFWEIKNWQTRFCCLYIKLTFLQIWRQLNKLHLSCSFWKSPYLAKNSTRENSEKTKPSIRKQTPPPITRKHLLKWLGESAMCRFSSGNPLVKFSRKPSPRKVFHFALRVFSAQCQRQRRRSRLAQKPERNPDEADEADEADEGDAEELQIPWRLSKKETSSRRCLRRWLQSGMF